MENKKYTAYLIGYNPHEWNHVEDTIQVDSLEEAKKWCDDNSSMYTYDWHVDRLVENK